MVTAPTNKAVTVLAERFLDVIHSAGDDLSCKYNAVLIGVEDKLISQSSQKEANYLSTETMSSPLRSIFVYSWADSLKYECQSLLARLKNLGEANRATNKKDTSIDSLISLAEKINQNLNEHTESKIGLCSCQNAASAAKSSSCGSDMGTLHI